MPDDERQPYDDEPLLPWLTHKRTQVLTIIAAAVFVLALSLYLSAITTPIAIGLVIAYVFNPVICWLQDKGLGRLWAVILFYVVFLLVVGLVLVTVLPPAAKQVMRLSDLVARKVQDEDDIMEGVQDAADDSNFLVGGFLKTAFQRIASEESPVQEQDSGADTPISGDGSTGPLAPNPVPGAPAITAPEDTATDAANAPAGPEGEEGFLEHLMRVGRENFGEIAARGTPLLRRLLQGAGTALIDFMGLIFQAVLVLIYAFFFMLGLDKASRAVKAYLPAHHKERILTIWTRLDSAYANFFRGRGVICLISGVLTSVGLLIVGIPFWLIIGMTVGILGIIPFIGVTLGLLPSLIMGYTMGGWPPVIGVLIVFAVVQSIEPILTPFILSRGTRIHPMTVLVALLAGGKLFGLLGAIIAVPLASTVKILLEEFVLPPLSEFAEEPNPLDEIHEEEHVHEEVEKEMEDIREIEKEMEEKYGDRPTDHHPDDALRKNGDGEPDKG